MPVKTAGSGRNFPLPKAKILCKLQPEQSGHFTVTNSTTAPVLGCIADDHTGATDIAGLLARSGHRVNLRLGVPEHGVRDHAPFEVIALKCRNLPAPEAVEQARAALLWLQTAGARRFYWKYCSTFDSTPTGNIGPIAEALMADLDSAQTLYCPAFPENGRTVYMGNLFVGAKPLAESPMKDHPLTPMRDSNLLRLLTPQVSGNAGLINHTTIAKGVDAIRSQMANLAGLRISNIVTDAINNQDLRAIAAASHHLPLLTGGSALAMMLPEVYHNNGLLPESKQSTPFPDLGDSRLVLAGSCSAKTREQVAHYLQNAAGYHLDPRDLAEGGLTAVRKWLSRLDPAVPKIIYATTAPEMVAKSQEQLGSHRAAMLIEEAMAQLAKDALKTGIKRIVVAGGETAGAVTRALGIDRMAIGAEIVPGVPWTYCKSRSKPLALALKSGNFGDDDFFERAFLEPDQP
jgi:uncharacterized protein YgbK (DUF1537 family)